MAVISIQSAVPEEDHTTHPHNKGDHAKDMAWTLQYQRQQVGRSVWGLVQGIVKWMTMSDELYVSEVMGRRLKMTFESLDFHTGVSTSFPGGERARFIHPIPRDEMKQLLWGKTKIQDFVGGADGDPLVEARNMWAIIERHLKGGSLTLEGPLSPMARTAWKQVTYVSPPSPLPSLSFFFVLELTCKRFQAGWTRLFFDDGDVGSEIMAIFRCSKAAPYKPMINVDPEDEFPHTTCFIADANPHRGGLVSASELDAVLNLATAYSRQYEHRVYRIFPVSTHPINPRRKTFTNMLTRLL